MANIPGEIVWQANNNAWFITNASEVFEQGITIYHEDGRYKFTDGVTVLSALPFLGNSSSGVQSVTGNQVDNTDPLNPVVLEQTTVNGETIETQNNKGQANGYPELDSSNRILFPAQANPSVKSIIRNINATPRNYIFPDSNGTIALTNDIPDVSIKKDKQVIASPTSQTAVNDTDYIVNVNTTFTDPSPVEAKGFTVFVRNGTATVGGTAYSVAGTEIKRIFHSGAWVNYVSKVSTTDYTQKFSHTGGTYTLTVAPSFIYSIRTTTMILDESDTNDVTISGTTLTITNPNFISGETLYIKYKA